MTHPQPTPPRIVEPDGTVHVGWFDQPFTIANLHESPIIRHIPGPFGALLRRGARRLRLKQWHYTSIATPDSFIAAAILNAGYLGVAFVYVVNRATGTVHEYSTMTPLGRGICIAPNSVDGCTSIVVNGFGEIHCDNDSSTGIRSLRIRLDPHHNSPALTADFTIVDDGKHTEPMIVVDKLAKRRWLYTHKCYGLDAEGTITLGETSTSYARGDALAGVDWNRGFRLYETFWNWAAATGRDTQGRIIGFTMTARKPTHGDDVDAAFSTENGDANDCALWLDGTRVKLRRVRFEYDPDNILGEWHIKDADGFVDLRFQPVGERIDDTNFGLIVSRFHQPYGVFRGTLTDEHGSTYHLDDVYGVTEEHFARW